MDAATKQGFAQRLGASVLDVISEFLDCARRYEANNTASLTGFAHFMRTSDGSNKREQQDHSEASSLRMLTVHGAKGLQSPIVILPDACRRRTPHNPLAVIDSGEGIGDIPLLAATPFASGVRAEKLEEAREVAKQAEANEDNRLLYVAMTRAEDGLYIAGFSKSHSRFLEDSWYGRLKEAMFAANADKTETGELLYGAMPTAMPSKPATAAKPAPPAIKIPPWVATNPPPSPAAKPRLVPSRLGDVLADTNEDPPPTPPLFIADAGSKKNRVALSRGNLVHRLFEVLPKLATTARMDAARRLIANMTQDNTLDLSESDKTALIQEVMAVMGLAELAPLFAEGSLAEMPISGHIGSYSVTGSIDRLAIGDDSIRFVDFKTDMTPPTNADKISQKYIDQIAAYAHLLSHIWADRPIAAGIVYTATPAVFWLDNAVLAAAIAPLLNK